MSFVGRIARPTLAVAAGAVGYSAYAAEPIRADTAVPQSYSSAAPGRSAVGDKLPIYPTESEPLVTLVEVENPITPYIAQARVATTDALSGASGYVRQGVSNWIDFERRAEREIKTVLPADEPLTPGIIYVLIAGLSGSVLTRPRAFPIRWLAPPLFTLASLPYFLPKTSHNLRNYISDVEDKHVPEFALAHDKFNARLEMHWEMLKDRLGNAEQAAGGWGEKAVRGIESTTGLKVGDALKKGQERVQQQREKMEGGLRIGDEPVKVQTVGYVVETKPVAEIVAPVTADAPANLPNATAAVEKPLVVPPPPALVEGKGSSVIDIAPTTPVAPVAVVDTAKAAPAKPKPEENKRLV